MNNILIPNFTGEPEFRTINFRIKHYNFNSNIEGFSKFNHNTRLATYSKINLIVENLQLRDKTEHFDGSIRHYIGIIVVESEKQFGGTKVYFSLGARN